MEEARSLQYSIKLITNIGKVEEGIQNLISQCGKLRTEASDAIDIEADTEQAMENIRELAGDIGGLQAEGDTIISIDADTSSAEENVREMMSGIGSMEASTVKMDVDTDQAQTDVHSLADSVANLGRDPPDIEVDVDTAEAGRNIRELTGDIGNMKDDAGSIGSAFRRSFLTGIDSGDSFASSLRSGVGGALTYAGDKAAEFKDNIVSQIKGAADNIAGSARSIGQGFAHPIETIKAGLGGAIDSAKNKFVGFVRGAEDAASAADDVGDAAAGAEPDVEDLGDTAEKSGSKFERLGDILKGIGKAAAVGLTTATVAIGGFAAASVNTGMAFDSSMSQVAATMGYSVAELNDATSEASQNFSQLREFATEMGANTAFSASQAADALNYMALAGYDADDSMAMLPNVLNLAAAGGIELASASDMVTDAQSALGLTLDETSELVDKMAAASSKSNTSVQQLGDAILTVGGTAKNLSGGTTELSMALGVLADNGIKGAEGGTALRNMILSLSAPTDKAAAQLKALGIEAFDTEGNLRPLNETFGDLNGALSTMTQEEQTQALNGIFNKVDLKAVNAMLGTSAERFGELSESIANSKGAAEDMAETQLDNLAGDITLFQSALEGAQIVISDSLAPTLREFVQFGGNAVSELSTAFQEGGLSGAMGALGGILGDGLGMMIEMLPTAIDAGMQLIGALGQGLLDNMPLIIDAAVQIVTLLGDGILDSLPVVAGAGMQVIASLVSGISGMLPELIPSMVETVGCMVGTLIENLPLVLDAGMQLIGGLADGIISAIPLLVEMLPVLIYSFVGFVTENLPTILEQGVSILTNLALGIVGALPELIGQIPLIISGIVGMLGENFPSIVSTGMTLLLELGSGIISAIPQLLGQLPAIGAAILGVFGEIPGMVTDVGKGIVEGLWSGISSMASWVGEKVKGFAGGVVDGIKGFLGIHSPSTVFAEIGDNMALGLGEGFGDSMAGVTRDIQEAIPINFDGPQVDIVASDMADLAALTDMVYKVSPDVEGYCLPGNSGLISDMVNPLVEGFGTETDGREEGDPETDGGDPHGFPFAPVINIEIVVQGNADSDALEELRQQLREEFEAEMRELFAEFREEELQRAALKNQYAF